MRTRWILPLSAAAAGLLLAAPAPAQDVEAIVRGAQAWGQQCVRCHSARPAGEYTDRQWTTIVLHMRARANLTRSEARLVTAFLQATNAPAGGQQAVGMAPEEGAEQDDNALWLASLVRYLSELSGSP